MDQAETRTGHSKLLVGYAVSTFAKSLPWIAADSFGLYFLTEVAGILPATAGTLVLVFYLFGAVCDPIAGVLFDRRKRDTRATRRYFIAAQLAAGLFFVAGFTAGLGVVGLLLAGLAFRAAYAVMDVPHNALLGVLARSGDQATDLGAARLCAALAASFAVTFGAGPVLYAAPSKGGEAFLLYAALIALAGGVLFLIILPIPPAQAEATQTGRDAAPSAIAGHLPRALPWFLSSMAAEGLIAGFVAKDAAYLSKYVFGGPGWAILALAALSAAKLAAVPIWLAVQRRFGLAGAWRGALALLIAASFGFAVLGPRPDFSLGLIFSLGVGLGGANMLAWASMGSLALKTSAGAGRPLASPFGAFTAVSKVALGLSGWLVGQTMAVAEARGGEPMRELIYHGFGLIAVLGVLTALVCLEVYWRLTGHPQKG